MCHTRASHRRDTALLTLHALTWILPVCEVSPVLSCHNCLHSWGDRQTTKCKVLEKQPGVYLTNRKDSKLHRKGSGFHQKGLSESLYPRITWSFAFAMDLGFPPSVYFPSGQMQVNKGIPSFKSLSRTLCFALEVWMPGSDFISKKMVFLIFC